MTRTRFVLSALLAALALPAGAQAATVSSSGGTIAFTAASGEANRLTVTGSNGAIRFEDTGVSSMTAGAGCSSKGAQRVDCDGTGVSVATLDLGDRDDWLSGQVLVSFNVYGGLGNDQITIFAGNDAVDAGAGNDTVDTGWGDDAIDGGEGADSISGGSGDDDVVYSGRTAPISVSLDDVANDGAAGEGDNVRLSIDDMRGGSGADTLTGDSGPNDLLGGGGDDTLTGGGGDDSLDGGSGTDTYSAGAGADVVRAREGVIEAIECGSEGDVAEADSGDVADADCEVVNRANAPVGTPPAVDAPLLPPAPTGGIGNVIEPRVATISAAPLAVSSSGVAAVRLKCPSEAFEGCAGKIVIGSKLGKRRFKLAAGRTATIPVRLHRRSWRRFQGRGRLKVQVTVTMETALGTTANTRTVTIKPAR